MENLNALKKNVQWQSLPKTFQDAMIVSRRLGIRYVWIDSLCIIQDDLSDWAREAARMASVYSYSYLTIAATKAANCEQGLFATSPPRPIQTLQTLNRDGKSLEVIVSRLGLPHWSGPRDTSDWPLLQRAWVWQERLLSPRVLHFCKDELIWECMEGNSCQCGDSNMGWYPTPPWVESKENTTDEKGMKTITHLDWHHIVEGYSSLSLSRASDKLPALAGLADKAQSSTRGRYFAGLWEKSLIVDLLWARDYRNTEGWKALPRPQGAARPTWSWVSIAAGIGFETERSSGLEQLCEILDVTCTPVDPQNPKGTLDSGSLVIRGHVLGAARTLHERLYIAGQDCGYLNLDYDIRHVGDYRAKEEDELFAIVIAQSITIDTYALVLRCLDESQHIYERIGLARLSDDLDVRAKPRWVAEMVVPGSSHRRTLVPEADENCEVLRIHQSKDAQGHLFTDSVDQLRVGPNAANREGYAEAKLTPNEVLRAENDLCVKDVHKLIEPSALHDPEEAKWFLSPQNEERKARGEKYFKYYLGKTITIV
jgi:hypothetical protein